MNPQELRVGNWVKHNNQEFQLYGVNKDYPFLDSEEFGSGVVEWDDLEPIPLTEEWLIKFGFFYNEELGNPQLRVLDGYITFYGIGTEEILCEISPNEGCFRFGMAKCEYVHQLQNLYFSLTGKELTS